MTLDFRRDRGSWRYKFEHLGQAYSGSGFETRRAAARAEEDRRREVEARSVVRGGSARLTLADWAELWLSDHVKVHCRPRTARLYRASLEHHVLPALGSLGLDELARPVLREHFARLAAGHGRSVVENAIIPLRACLSAAVDDGLLDVNPASSLGRRLRARTEGEAARVSSYTKAQLDAILGADPGLAVRLLAGSGLRIGEALGLQQDDVTEDHLWVRRNVQWQNAEPHVLAPKSGQTRRVDITTDLAARLKAGATPYVLSGERPGRPEPIRKGWYRLLDGLAVPKYRLHDLRHTYAALLLAAGAPPSYVKEQLGHSSIQVTIDIYGHLIPGENRKWVDSTFGGSSSSPGSSASSSS